ncbi:MAG: SCO6745 family protein [Actinomycetes bacterium]
MDHGVTPEVARKMWRTLEPYHSMVYFAPEGPEEYAKLGLDVEGNKALAYFPARAAAMGAVSPGVVQAVFFNFSALATQFGMAGVWETTTPAAVVEARLRAADRALRRLCGHLLDTPDVVEALELARTACEGCRPEGRPLYAGLADLPWPTEPHLQLWHAIALLREFRGDGHVASLTASGVSGIEAAVMHVAQGDAWTREPLRKTRGYSTEQWDTALAGLRERGWIERDGEGFTDEGRRVRQEVEDRTDVLALPPWQQLGEQGCTRLREVVWPLSKAIVEAGGVGIR